MILCATVDFEHLMDKTLGAHHESRQPGLHRHRDSCHRCDEPVVLIPEELAAARVAYRVQAGGHALAENTIRERYHRLWALIAEAIARCDQATVYDNSGIKGPLIVAQMSDGFIVGSPVWPHWTPPVLQSHWPTGLFATPCANERIIGRPAWLRSGRRWRPRRGGSGCSHTPGRRWPHAWPQSAHAGRSNA